MRQNLGTFSASLDEIIPDLTLGELVVLFEKIDYELNRQLLICPITDTHDLRSCHIRKEVHFHEFENQAQESDFR
jgi:hypothetical protein